MLERGGVSSVISSTTMVLTVASGNSTGELSVEWPLSINGQFAKMVVFVKDDLYVKQLGRWDRNNESVDFIVCEWVEVHCAW